MNSTFDHFKKDLIVMRIFLSRSALLTRSHAPTTINADATSNT
jgi:hypothetical protein